MKNLILLLMSALCLLCIGCKTQKPYDQMTDEEKINLVVTGEHDLSNNDIDKQHELRTQILNQVNQGNLAATELDKALKSAQDLVPPSMLDKFNEAQDLWNKHTKGAEINVLLKEGRAIQAANAEVLIRRADKIQELVNRAILVETPNTFQGYYRATQGQSLEIFELNQQITVTIRSVEPRLVIAAIGTPSEPQMPVIIHSDTDDRVSFALKRLDDHTIELTPQAEFTASPLAPFAPTFSAQFKRIAKEDPNVFTF